MVRRNLLKNITTSGGLLTADFIQSFQEPDYKHDKITPQSFNLPKKPVEKQEELNRIITEAWEKLKAIWDENSLKMEEMSSEEARKVLIRPLLRELGFSLVTVSQDIEFEDGSIKLYLSHRGWWEDEAPKIHTVSPRQDLDERSPEDRNDRNPHDVMQLYLNLDKEQKWGIITNGVLLRILREFHHSYTRGYVEFDLVNIFFERNFSDFLSLFRLSHASRYLEKDGIIPLEQFYEESVAAGVKVGEDLRENVKNAIELLGNGLLTNELRNTLADNPEMTKKYYRELLKIIYRILFLMFAEQRGMLPMHDSLYAEEYSLTRLREKAQLKILLDTHCDLWFGLLKTFTLIREGNNDLKVFGYNGDLFDDEKLDMILNLKCRNDILLKAIRYLTLYQKRKIMQRINFLDIGVEELGSIYESLLDFIPRVLTTAEVIDGNDYQTGRFLLDSRGTSRKTTGSYYTDKRLINELINTALKPVAEKALEVAGNTREEKEKAILELKICDPACGSGAFLIAANDYLGKLLTQIRTGEEFPSERKERIARRDVLQHCIYGVDLNPMAIELAKVSLWINAVVKDFPLNFLNHHLKAGNSLLGAFPRHIKEGISKNAFKPIEGEDKKLVRQLKEINNSQRKSKAMPLDKFLSKTGQALNFKSFKNLSNNSEETVEEVRRKRKKYQELIREANFKQQTMIYDTWTSTFFWPYVKEWRDAPTQGFFRLIMEGSFNAVKHSILDKIKNLGIEFSFFHWNLEFPEVLGSKDGGFDCILGNPPWERVKLQEREFFETRAPEIVKARNASQRKRMIKEKIENDTELASEYNKALYQSRKISHFLRSSGLFKFTGKGDVNTYSVFTEQIVSLLSAKGRAGIIVPTGIATDFFTQDFFKQIIENQRLISLFDFVNSKKIFPEVHGSYKFSLLTLGGSLANIRKANFAFFLTDPERLLDDENSFQLDKNDFKLLNPNTQTCPVFRNRKIANITKGIYSRVPILIEEKGDLEVNPWKISFVRMIDVSNDSYLFKSHSQLISDNFNLENESNFKRENVVYLPLYTGRMIDLYDYRAASVAVQEEKKFTTGKTVETSIQNYNDPNYMVLPAYWVKKEEVEKRIPEWYQKDFLFGFRNVTNSTNKRTFICSIFPKTAAGNAIPLMLSPLDTRYIMALAANLSTLVFDFVARQKIGGMNMNFYIIKQLPVFPPDFYQEGMLMKIIPRVMELYYTSNAIRPLAKEIGFEDTTEPFEWNIERRLQLKCELEAIFANYYGLSRDELGFILDTFPIIRREDEKKYGDYRTKTLVLDHFDNITLMEEKS